MVGCGPGLLCVGHSLSVVLGFCSGLEPSKPQIQEPMAQRWSDSKKQKHLLCLHCLESGPESCLGGDSHTIQCWNVGVPDARLFLGFSWGYQTWALEFLQVGEWTFEQCWQVQGSERCSSTIPWDRFRWLRALHRPLYRRPLTPRGTQFPTSIDSRDPHWQCVESQQSILIHDNPTEEVNRKAPNLLNNKGALNNIWCPLQIWIPWYQCTTNF